MNAETLYRQQQEILIKLIIGQKEKSPKRHFGVWAKSLTIADIGQCLVSYFRQTRCHFDREEIWLMTRAILAEILILPNQADQDRVVQLFWKYCLALHFRDPGLRSDLEDYRWFGEQTTWTSDQIAQFVETCWHLAYQQVEGKSKELFMVEKAVILKQGTRRRLQMSLLLGEESHWLVLWLRLTKRLYSRKPYRRSDTVPIEDYQK